MIISVNIAEKSFGDKILYENLRLDVQDGEKVGLIGRNGTGKTTLLHIMTEEDTDYDGEVRLKRGAVVVGSRQEHHAHDEKSVLEYVLGDMPEYEQLKHILDTYPTHMGDSKVKLENYSDALERFNQLGYFEVEGEITEALRAYQIDETKVNDKLVNLSGGQKRLVELAKVQRARADLALIDEPTNHMDFIAKKAFIKWFKSAREAVVVITHDRDLLHVVDRIIEIRDGHAYPFAGNYDAYLRVNAIKTVSEVNEFSVVQRRISNLKEDIIRFRRLKERSRDPGTIQRFKASQIKAEEELAVLQAKDTPSFWIDRESASELNDKMGAAYEKHKARNIRVQTGKSEEGTERTLVEVSKLSLGYGETPLFNDVNFVLREGDRTRLHGRNGAGKSTLVSTILASAANKEPSCKVFAGNIAVEREISIGIYEQEIPEKYLFMTLGRAIEHAYMVKDVPIGDEKIKKLLGDYLFNPATDVDAPMTRLSGGQKARFQLINMLAGDPQVLILDEPTNHLDLPSIEELEDALARYNGAILYISHDSYFAKNIGGDTITIDKKA